MSHIAVYTPEVFEIEEEEVFVAVLESIARPIPSSDTLIVTGDFSATILRQNLL